MSWFNTPVHPVFVRDGADKFLELPIVPEEQCWIDLCGRVHIANIYCGAISEAGGFLYITSPSGMDSLCLGYVSLFHNEPPRNGVMGKTEFYQRVCDLCGFGVEILVADQGDSAFNQQHNLSPGSVRFVVHNSKPFNSSPSRK